MMDETHTPVDTPQQVTSKVPETQTQQGISKVQAEKCFWMGLMASSLLINAVCLFLEATPEQSSVMINAACLFLEATREQITE